MKYLPLTYQILYYRVLENIVSKEWIDWAIEMIQAGFETESLLYLASFEGTENQFELREISDRAFKELGLDFSDKEQVVKNYANYTVDCILTGKMDYLKALRKLKNMCLALNYPKFLMDFYLLYFAKEDLINSPVQWYWTGADKNNIDSIIEDYCKSWRAKFNIAPLQ